MYKHIHTHTIPYICRQLQSRICRSRVGHSKKRMASAAELAFLCIELRPGAVSSKNQNWPLANSFYCILQRVAKEICLCSELTSESSQLSKLGQVGWLLLVVASEETVKRVEREGHCKFARDKLGVRVPRFSIQGRWRTTKEYKKQDVGI